jgi:hypothetical protein
MSASAVQIREFPIPTGNLGRNILICGVVMLVSARRELIAPGSVVYEYLLAGRPDAIMATTVVQNILFYFFFGAHAVRSAMFAFGKLQRHGVPVVSIVWWKWMFACFIGGKFTFEHFDNVVAAATGQKKL